MRRVALAWRVGLALVSVATACSSDDVGGTIPLDDRRSGVADLAATPAQGEGPFYPVAKPEDRDSDLTVVAGAAGEASGDVLVIDGELVSQDGTPIPNATVEIWQVDSQGVYLHPADPGIDVRDPFFQGYGESHTDSAGRWSFRTITPGLYGNRPRHVHMKVTIAGNVVLTTQIYFTGDALLETDALSGSAGDGLTLLTTEPVSDTDENGEPILIANHRIVLDV